MKKTIILTAILFSLSINQVVSACDEEKEVSNVKDDKVITDEQEEKSIQQIVLSDPESVKKGEKTFNSLCVYCHGAGGSGGKAKKLVGRNLQVDYIFTTITNGKKRGSLNMPPWRKLAEEKRWTLVAYVRSLQKKSD